MTAAVILQLAQENKLSLGNAVSQVCTACQTATTYFDAASPSSVCFPEPLQDYRGRHGLRIRTRSGSGCRRAGWGQLRSAVVATAILPGECVEDPRHRGPGAPLQFWPPSTVGNLVDRLGLAQRAPGAVVGVRRNRCRWHGLGRAHGDHECGAHPEAHDLWAPRDTIAP